MRTKNELYQEALRTVARRRQTAGAKAEDARAEAEAAVPGLRHAEEEVRVRGIRCAIAGASGKDRTETAAALAAAKQKLTALLAGSGRPADALEPKFTCKRCEDTGAVDGRTCDCVRRVMQQLRRKEIEELSAKYGLDVQLDKLITEISVGEQQRTEILKALYHGAELLILDEPSAALTDIEVEGLFAIMQKLIGEGKSIIFISHKMREVLHISDRITVLRLGEVVGTVARADTDGQKLANMMIGKELTESQYEKVDASGAEVVASLDHVDYDKEHKHSGVNDMTLQIRSGEIVGIAGVDGNGQTQLAQLITGVIAPQGGKIYLKDRSVAVFDPHSFITDGVSYVPEDRNAQGLVGDMSIAENLVLKETDSPKFSRGKGLRLNKRAIHDYAEEMVQKYDVRCTSVGQTVRSLSGGNQQKVILARELESQPSLLVMAHPTRGLDIGAASFVHEQMIAARARGVGILLISADFDEILEMSDRILVCFEGQIMGEFSGKNPPIEEISLAMTGK